MSFSAPAVRPSAVRRRRRGPRILLVVVLVLAALVVAADRVGVRIAERVAADQLQASQKLPSTPDVDITGFPFLTQLAAGRYDEIDVTAKNVPLRGAHGLALSQLAVSLEQLTASRDFTSFHAHHATARGTIGYRDLGDALGVSLSYAGNGRVRASKQITIAGRTITPTVTARVAVADDVLSFAATGVSGLGELAEDFTGDLERLASEVFGNEIRLGTIPFQITVRHVGLDENGLELDLAGSDLNYSR